MLIRESLLKEAFKAALEDEQVKSIEADNADEQIREAMIRYIDKKEAEERLNQIDRYIDLMTQQEDDLLPELYHRATEEADIDPESDADRVQREMMNLFREQDADIRHKRIQLYIRDQVNKRNK